MQIATIDIWARIEMDESKEHTEIIEAEGHLVDSRVLTAILDKVIERSGRF